MIPTRVLKTDTSVISPCFIYFALVLLFFRLHLPQSGNL